MDEMEKGFTSSQGSFALRRKEGCPGCRRGCATSKLRCSGVESSSLKENSRGERPTGDRISSNQCHRRDTKKVEPV